MPSLRSFLSSSSSAKKAVAPVQAPQQQPRLQPQLQSQPTHHHHNSTVLLHELCDNCERFFSSWSFIDVFRYSKKPRDQDCRPTLLCTVSHLTTQAYNACHFCTLLLSALERWPSKSPESKPRENVYVRGIATSEDEVIIWVYAGSRPAVREADEKETCAVLPLRKLSCK